MTRRARLAATVVAVALFGTACAAGGTPEQTAGTAAAQGATSNGAKGSSASVELERTAVSPRQQDVASALQDPSNDTFPQPLIPLEELKSGGPPPDGIPPIDDPRFHKPDQVDWIAAEEPVLALELNGDRRAYPLKVMIWHEIVNDTVGGVPVAVTYCPLCNSALAYDRRIGGQVLDFGTSGQLYNSDLVMYDRQTESLWTQLLGKAVVGELTGTDLTAYPVATVAWEDWRAANPDGWVLSRDTGHPRDYGRNPYARYDDPEGQPLLFDKEADARLPAMARVVGLREGAESVAVVTTSLLKRGVVEVELAGQDVVVWALPGTRSALDQAQISEGRDVGATGAFSPVVDGERLHFRRDGDGFRDTETGSRWDVLGRAVSGDLEGERLTRAEYVDTFWFAWAAFLPDTRVVG
jgi:hypothetical protein